MPRYDWMLALRIKQILDDEIVIKLFNDLPTEIVRHDMSFDSKTEEKLVAQAESFGNSYNVFTLISQPKTNPIKTVSKTP